MLEEAGIKPDHHHRYTSSQIQDALSKTTGHRVTLECKHGQLKEVWYHFHVRGSLQSGEFVPADPGTSLSCLNLSFCFLVVIRCHLFLLSVLRCLDLVE